MSTPAELREQAARLEQTAREQEDREYLVSDEFYNDLNALASACSVTKAVYNQSYTSQYGVRETLRKISENARRTRESLADYHWGTNRRGC